MFSKITHSVGGRFPCLLVTITRDALGHGILTPTPTISPMGLTLPYYWHLVVIIGDLFKLAHLRTCSRPVLTSSGSHQNTYGWQAGGTRHTATFLSSFRDVSARATCISDPAQVLLTTSIRLRVPFVQHTLRTQHDVWSMLQYTKTS